LLVFAGAFDVEIVEDDVLERDEEVQPKSIKAEIP
jgi:hypothetical protein